MADDRIGVALDRIGASLERIEATNQHLDVTTERVRLEFERNRAFNREMLERWEAEADAGREVLSALVAQINDMRREIRAQTEAIFRVIDRLDGGGGARPATP